MADSPMADPKFGSMEGIPIDDEGRPLATHQLVRRPILMYGALVVSVGIAAVVSVRTAREKSLEMAGRLRELTRYAPTEKSLLAKYRDQDSNLLADPPTNPQQLVDPSVLTVAHFDDDGKSQVDWETYATRLAKLTGKRVELINYLQRADQIEAIAAGQIHVVALHAADLPHIVNNCGLVPFASWGKSGVADGNCMVIATSVSSPVESLADVRGRTLTCTRPDSVSGYRLAISILALLQKMKPNIDYQVEFSHAQGSSIRGLTLDEIEIAAVSSNKLRSMIEGGSVKESQFRRIYESPPIPRLVIGYIHRLSPDLAEKIMSATLEFRELADGRSGVRDDEAGFFQINYKADFELEREIDSKFDPRIRKSILLRNDAGT